MIKKSLRCGEKLGSARKEIDNIMKDPEFYEEVARLAVSDLEREPDGFLPERKVKIDRNTLKLKLEQVISFMLDNEFEKLCNAMYRLDVSEKLFHQALTENPKEIVPSLLAELVIEREIKKVETRKLYRDGKL